MLDLSRWDFKRDRAVPIKGDVLLYWNRLYDPSTIDSASRSEAVISTAGMNWNNVKGPAARPARGFGTYRMRVLLPEPGMDLGLMVSNQDTAYRMWVNGALVSSNGRVSGDPREAVPEYRDEVVFIHAGGAALDIVIQMSNHDLRCGGWGNDIVLGEPGAVIAADRRDYLAGAIPVFCLGFLFVYHFVNWLFRRKEIPHLYFSLSLLCVAVATGFSPSVYPFYGLMPFIPWVVGYKAQFICISLFILFFFLYLRSLFPRDIPRAFMWAVGAASLALSAAIAALPVYAVSMGLTVAFQVYAVGVGVAGSLLILLAAVRRRENALLILCGILVIVACAACDSLSSNMFVLMGLIGSTLPYGLLAFLLLHSLLLARRFAMAYDRLDRLTEGLESEVAQRTADLSAANERLTRADRERTDFFIHLSHEIKTPLTLVINAMDDLAGAGSANPAPADPALETIRANLDVLLKEIIDFFDLMKVEKGIHVYHHDSLMDLSAFVKGKADLFNSRARASGLSLEARVEPGIILRADPSSVDRLLNNLLENAVKYNRPGGGITVDLSRTGGEIRLLVADTGIGIEPAQRDDIFLPYYRVQGAHGRVQGLGVGLAIVKSIVDSLSASITVDGNEPRGTRFTVVIPARDADRGAEGEPLVDAKPFLTAPLTRRAAAQGTGARAEGDAALAGRSVAGTPPGDAPLLLVVEDNDELAEAVCARLSRSWRVRRAADGAGALALLSSLPRAALVISDIMMPGMDGFTLLDRVKEREEWRDIPFLFLSAVTLDAERARAYEKGALDFIHKPFHMDDLESKARSLLRHQSLLRDLEERRTAAGFGLLLSSVAHEIFNPLSGISAPLAVLKKRLADSGRDAPGLPAETAAKHIGYIEANVRRIEAIVTTVRDMQMGRPLPMERVDLRGLVDAQAAVCRERRPDVEWRCGVPAGLMVTANALALERIIANIAENALDAQPDGGTISIDLERDADGGRTLRVTDAGPGLPAGVLAAAFQPYVTTKGSGHMGMGLFLVRQLASRMGWDCSVHSPPGQGAAFRLRIPREPEGST